MAKISNNFRFTGELKTIKDGLREVLPKDTSKKWKGMELTLSVKTAEGNQLVRLFGGEFEGETHIETLSKDKGADGKLTKLKIPLTKLTDKAVVDTVADFKKVKVLDKTFLREIDAIQYIQQNIVDLEGKRVTVSGKVEMNVSKGKVYTKFILQNIYEAKEDAKNEFRGNLALYVNKDTIAEDYFKGKSINYSMIEKDKKIPLTVYLAQYNSNKDTKKDKPTLYIPTTVFITVNDKFDFKNEEHMKRLKFKLESMIVRDENIYEIGWDVRFFKGAEKTAITTEDLTKFEKAQIENGVKTFEEIVKYKEGYGEYKEEIQLVVFHGAYSDGLEKTTLTENDLEVLFYSNEDTIIQENTKVTEVINDEDLF